MREYSRQPAACQIRRPAGQRDEKGKGAVQDEQRIAQLREAIAQLKARFPKHSVPPAMMIELEELEEELDKAVGGKGHDPDPRFIL